MSREQDNALVRQLHESGYSIRQIADETGISKSSVGRMVKEIQGSSPGTALGTRPAPETGTAGSVPGAGWDSGNEAVPPLQAGNREANAFWDGLMLRSHREHLRNTYTQFLDFTDALFTRDFFSEESVLSAFETRQQRVREITVRLRGVCSDCGVDYDGLFMAYVLGQLYLLLGQTPELEKSYGGFRLKASAVLVSYLGRAARLDVFTPMEEGIGPFPVGHMPG